MTAARTKERWEAGDLVQISPLWDAKFGGSILVVEEVRSWGVLGYVVVPKNPVAAAAYYRLPYDPGKAGVDETGKKVGRAEWLIGGSEGGS